MYNPQVADFLQAPVTASRFGWGLRVLISGHQLSNSPSIPPSSHSASSQRGDAPQQSSAPPSWARLSIHWAAPAHRDCPSKAQHENQSSTERCQSQALIPPWMLLISLGSLLEKIFTHHREGRSLAQGDWAAELDQSPELSQRFSERQREGGREGLALWRVTLPSRAEGCEFPIPTPHAQLK